VADATNSNSSSASGASRARNMMAHPVLAAVLRPDIGLAVGVVLILSIMLRAHPHVVNRCEYAGLFLHVVGADSDDVVVYPKAVGFLLVSNHPADFHHLAYCP
jgi:hypothetical protein